MLHTSFAGRVGVAPGTTTLRISGGLGEAAPVPPGPFYYRQQAMPTQARWEPDPNTDNVKIAVPPNQWVTGPMTMRISMPAVQRTMGPVPNDGQLAKVYGYLPAGKGWIEPSTGETIYNLQGLGQDDKMSRSDKWILAASIVSAAAVATTATLAIVRFRRDGKRRRRR